MRILLRLPGLEMRVVARVVEERIRRSLRSRRIEIVRFTMGRLGIKGHRSCLCDRCLFCSAELRRERRIGRVLS